MLPRRTFPKWRFPYLPCDATKRQMDGNLEKKLTSPSRTAIRRATKKLLCWLLSFLLGLVGS